MYENKEELEKVILVAVSTGNEMCIRDRISSDLNNLKQIISGMAI